MKLATQSCWKFLLWSWHPTGNWHEHSRVSRPLLFWYSAQHVKSHCQPYPANQRISLLISTLQQPLWPKHENLQPQLPIVQKESNNYTIQVILFVHLTVKYELRCKSPLCGRCIIIELHKLWHDHWTNYRLQQTPLSIIHQKYVKFASDESAVSLQ